jgi:hypothetical protein
MVIAQRIAELPTRTPALRIAVTAFVLLLAGAGIGIWYLVKSLL